MKCPYCGMKLEADSNCNLVGTLFRGEYHPENRDGYMTKLHCGNPCCEHGYAGNINMTDKKIYGFQVFDPDAKIQKEFILKSK